MKAKLIDIRMVTTLMLWCLSFVAILSGCEEEATPPQAAQKGEREMGFHITEASGLDYNASFDIAAEAGMGVVTQNFYWTTLEPTAGNYQFDFLDIANTYFPAKDVAVSLNLSPIEAIDKAFPADLQGRSFNDPEVIARFNALLDSMHTRMPDVDIYAFLLGNEVDLYLAQHPDEWSEFEIFYEAAVAKIRSLWGNQIMVGVENTLATFNSEYADEIESLNEVSDFIAFTYYPLNPDFTMKAPDAIFAELQTIVDAYPNRKLYLEETGYASSEVCNSSEEQQRQFVNNMFRFWDDNNEQLIYIGFLWLHDLSESTASFFVDQYGMTGHPNVEAFKEYLRTTGMRTFEGTSKPAFNALKENAKERGF